MTQKKFFFKSYRKFPFLTQLLRHPGGKGGVGRAVRMADGRNAPGIHAFKKCNIFLKKCFCQKALCKFDVEGVGIPLLRDEEEQVEEAIPRQFEAKKENAKKEPDFPSSFFRVEGSDEEFIITARPDLAKEEEEGSLAPLESGGEFVVSSGISFGGRRPAAALEDEVATAPTVEGHGDQLRPGRVFDGVSPIVGEQYKRPKRQFKQQQQQADGYFARQQQYHRQQQQQQQPETRRDGGGVEEDNYYPRRRNSYQVHLIIFDEIMHRNTNYFFFQRPRRPPLPFPQAVAPQTNPRPRPNSQVRGGHLGTPAPALPRPTGGGGGGVSKNPFMQFGGFPSRAPPPPPPPPPPPSPRPPSPAVTLHQVRRR